MYYLWFNETQSGPYTIQQVRSLWASGQITSETLYWMEGKTEWEPLGSILSEIESQPIPPVIAHTTVLPAFEQAIVRKTDRRAPPRSDLPKEAEPAPADHQPEATQWTGHPTLWKWAWLLAAGVVLILLCLGLFLFYSQGPILNLLPIVLALPIFVYVSLVRNATTYTVTNRRVSVEAGIFNKTSRELRIQDIRSIAAKMNIIGYGNIEFSSAASDDADVVFTAVPRAAAVRDLVKKLQS